MFENTELWNRTESVVTKMWENSEGKIIIYVLNIRATTKEKKKTPLECYSLFTEKNIIRFIIYYISRVAPTFQREKDAIR